MKTQLATKSLLVVLSCLSIFDSWRLVWEGLGPKMSCAVRYEHVSLRGLSDLENYRIGIVLLVAITWLATIPIRTLIGPWKKWAIFVLVVQLLVFASFIYTVTNDFILYEFTLQDVKHEWIATYNELFLL